MASTGTTATGIGRTTATAATATTATITVKDTIDAKLAEAGAAAGVKVTYEPAQLPKVRFKSFTAVQGQKGVSMMRRDQRGFFAKVGFTDAEAEADCQREEDLQHAVNRGEAFTNSVKAELYSVRNRIADRNRVLAGVVIATTTPGKESEEDRQSMLNISADFTAVSTTFNTGVQSSRDSLSKARTSAKPTVDKLSKDLKAAQAEIQALRGKNLGADDLNAPAQPAKKGGRKGQKGNRKTPR